MINEVPVLKAEWFFTRRCNLKCGYCEIRKNVEGILNCSTDDAIEMVKMFSELWPGAPMVVYGGEPTLRDDLPEIIAAGVEYGVKLPVISNSIRVLMDIGFRERLLDAGLSNWSVSLDTLAGVPEYDASSKVKSSNGYRALRMFRDRYGIRDLVACITVTKNNIEYLPEMVRQLTSEGIWAIMTPLQIGGPEHLYGKGDPVLLASQEQAVRIGRELFDMAKSGGYLFHNDPEWFSVWPELLVKNRWKCTGKAALTIDADGSLRYCVDIPMPEKIFALELRTPEGRAKYNKLIKDGVSCQGCSWDQNVECLRRSKSADVGVTVGRQRSRHELHGDRLLRLIPEAQRWFYGNPRLERQVIAPPKRDHHGR